MKIIIFALFIIALETTSIAYSASSSPTKKDTAEFILSKIAADPYLHHYDYRGTFQKNNNSSFSKDYCTFSWGNYNRVPLSLPITINQYPFNEVYVIEINCTAGEEKCSKFAPDNGFAGISLKTISKLTADKLVSAFTHLNAICSGKKELF